MNAKEALVKALADAPALGGLHNSASNNADGYEWGLYRVKWENGRVVEVWTRGTNPRRGERVTPNV
jgi:hypothetical protein